MFLEDRLLQGGEEINLKKKKSLNCFLNRLSSNSLDYSLILTLTSRSTWCCSFSLLGGFYVYFTSQNLTDMGFTFLSSTYQLSFSSSRCVLKILFGLLSLCQQDKNHTIFYHLCGVRESYKSQHMSSIQHL